MYERSFASAEAFSLLRPKYSLRIRFGQNRASAEAPRADQNVKKDILSVIFLKIWIFARYFLAIQKNWAQNTFEVLRDFHPYTECAVLENKLMMIFGENIQNRALKRINRTFWSTFAFRLCFGRSESLVGRILRFGRSGKLPLRSYTNSK